MKKIVKKVFSVLCIIPFLTFPITSFAHSGRTDSSGGHHDYNNKSGLGGYHYHCNGHPPHLHDGGICPYAPKDKITINSYQSTMYVGSSQKVGYNVVSAYDYVSAYVTSSNDSVISVSGKKLKAKSAGTATITIETDTASKSFTITVKEVYAKSVKMSVPSKKLQIGKTMSISSKVSPENTTNKDIKYSTSDKTIATISSDGTVKGISSGTVTIKATTSNGISQKQKIKIFEVCPETIQSDEAINLIVGDTYDLQVAILPENANNKEYTITSKDEEILKNSNTSLQAVKEGNTSLVVKTWNGIEKEIPVTVDIIPVKEVDIIDSNEYIFSNVIDISDEIKLSSVIEPKNATYKDVKWKSSNPDVVTIEDNKFIVKDSGKVVLTCCTHEDVTNSIEITVINKNLIILVAGVSVAVICAGIVLVVRWRKKTKTKQIDI